MSRDDVAGAVWPAALALTAVGGSLAAGCMTPSVALAVVMAATLPAGRAAVGVLGAWLANQALGFGLLGYPLDASTLAWGGAIGAAALLSLLAARAAGVRRSGLSVRLIPAFLLAFAAYEGALYVFALFAGGLETFAPSIVARIGLNEAGWFAALLAVRWLLERTAPGWFGASAVSAVRA